MFNKVIKKTNLWFLTYWFDVYLSYIQRKLAVTIIIAIFVQNKGVKLKRTSMNSN